MMKEIFECQNRVFQDPNGASCKNATLRLSATMHGNAKLDPTTCNILTFKTFPHTLIQYINTILCDRV